MNKNYIIIISLLILTAAIGLASTGNVGTMIMEVLIVDTDGLVYDNPTGRVGIGTASPGDELDVVGDVKISNQLGVGISPSGSIDAYFFGNGLIKVQPSTTSTNATIDLTGRGGASFANTEIRGTPTPSGNGGEIHFLTDNSGGTLIDRGSFNRDGKFILVNLQGTHTGGSAFVCVNNAGELFTSESVCP